MREKSIFKSQMMFYIHLKVETSGGLHTRPCAAISRLAKDHDVSCFLVYKDQKVNVHSILDMLSLCVRQGDEILFELEGENADIFIQDVNLVIK